MHFYIFLLAVILLTGIIVYLSIVFDKKRVAREQAFLKEIEEARASRINEEKEILRKVKLYLTEQKKLSVRLDDFETIEKKHIRRIAELLAEEERISQKISTLLIELQKIDRQTTVNNIEEQVVRLSEDGRTVLGVDDLDLTHCKIPDNVTCIESNAFGSCKNLVSIEIPSSVTKIGANAFYYCTKLSHIDLPENIQEIGEAAFYCAMSVSLSPKCSNFYLDEYGVLFDKVKKCLLFAPRNLAGDYIIPEGITRIGERAFWKCSNLNRIVMPESIEIIGDWAFYGCIKLERIKLSEHILIDVGNYAFHGCFRLKTETLPLYFFGPEIIDASLLQENDYPAKID